jgi:hypothetical protein
MIIVFLLLSLLSENSGEWVQGETKFLNLAIFCTLILSQFSICHLTHISILGSDMGRDDRIKYKGGLHMACHRVHRSDYGRCFQLQGG